MIECYGCRKQIRISDNAVNDGDRKIVFHRRCRREALDRFASEELAIKNQATTTTECTPTEFAPSSMPTGALITFASGAMSSAHRGLDMLALNIVPNRAAFAERIALLIKNAGLCLTVVHGRELAAEKKATAEAKAKHDRDTKDTEQHCRTCICPKHERQKKRAAHA